MLTVQYNGPEKTINGAVWYRGEIRQASPKQLAGWQAEHGDVFVVTGAEPQPDTSGDVEARAADAAPKAKRK